MANGMGDWLEDQFLKLLDGTLVLAAPNVSTPAAANWGLGLLTALPGDQGSGSSPQDGTEVANAGNYARLALPLLSSWGALFSAAAPPSARARANLNQLVFPASGSASAPWGVPLAWALWDSITYGAGHLWFYGLLPPGVSAQINVGGILILPPGTVIIGAD